MRKIPGEASCQLPVLSSEIFEMRPQTGRLRSWGKEVKMKFIVFC